MTGRLGSEAGWEVTGRRTGRARRPARKNVPSGARPADLSREIVQTSGLGCAVANAGRQMREPRFLPVGKIVKFSPKSRLFLPNSITILLTITLCLLYDIIVMSEDSTKRSGQPERAEGTDGAGDGAVGNSVRAPKPARTGREGDLGNIAFPPASARLHLDVPLGTTYYEIQEMIFRQAWQLAGTQLRAAVALGITPDTISRFLRRCDRERRGPSKLPAAWREVTGASRSGLVNNGAATAGPNPQDPKAAQLAASCNVPAAWPEVAGAAGASVVNNGAATAGANPQDPKAAESAALSMAPAAASPSAPVFADPAQVPPFVESCDMAAGTSSHDNRGRGPRQEHQAMAGGMAPQGASSTDGSPTSFPPASSSDAIPPEAGNSSPPPGNDRAEGEG